MRNPYLSGYDGAQRRTKMNGAIILMLIAFSYFLPTFVAIGRGHKEFLGISIINIFLGWTLLGWVVALAWACTSNVKNIR